MPLKSIEVENFKSYKGKQTIGPFFNFSCVIGPNGAGKSNLMDAISFVLGVRSAQLRSSQLKDLIYRGTRLDAMNTAMDEDGEDRVVAADSASVTAVYIDKQGKEYRFQRNIASNGTSEYRINGQAMSFAKYNAVLEQHNILVKAKNFLVFQGDVEAVAQQSPRDLSKLIEQICGSGELKDEYDRLEKLAEKATEASTSAFNKRRGINTEIKQFKEQKAEALKFDQLCVNRDQAVVRHCVWKLFHIQNAIQERVKAIDAQNQVVASLKEEQVEAEAKLKAARKEQHAAQKKVTHQERLLKKREKDADDKKPFLLAAEGRIEHTTKKIRNTQHVVSQVEKDRDARAASLKSLKRDLKDAIKAQQKHQEKVRAARQAESVVLSEQDLAEYNKLKAQASTRAIKERQEIDALRRDLRSKRDNMASLQDKLDAAKHQKSKLVAEESSLVPRQQSLENKLKELEDALSKTKRELQAAVAERTKTNQLQTELNEKLQECYQKLLQAGADQRESDREAKLKETIQGLQRSMPGKVLGRVMDLVKPNQRKYDTAVTVVLGRHIDSIVVDTEATAVACIQDMRNSRSGIATFLPLDTISAKPINDKYRSLTRDARLAVDVVTYDASVERAVHHVCGNAMVCDTIDVAKYVCYEKGQEVKAVTLDGTVFHKAGLITGGAQAAAGGRKWDEGQVQGLKRLEENLRAQLAEMTRNKPRTSQDQVFTAEISRIESDLAVTKDDLNAANTRLQGVRSELSVLNKQIKKLSTQLEQLSAEHVELEQTIAKLRTTIDKEEGDIFSEFCERLGIADIQEYEETQHRQAQEEGEMGLKLRTHISRLEHQITFEEAQLKSIEERLGTLSDTLIAETSNLERIQAERDATRDQLEEIESELESMRETLQELENDANEKTTAAETIKRATSRTNAAYQKAIKEISSWNDDIERLGSDRFAVYRRCKLEEIDLPLVTGSLKDVPLEEVVRDTTAMDLDDADDSIQKPVRLDDFGVEVDFDSLDEEEQEDGSPEMEVKLQGTIARLADQIQKMSPNMKAISRLDEVEAKLAETDKGFAKARKEAQQAKEAFAAIKRKRRQLFLAAYNHLSENIDVVYKELTMGKASPMGGVAYLSLEDDEEPYLHGIKYHAMPPMKRFRDMDQLSGGEKTMAALALLFAIHSFHPSPFFVLDEVDAALDNTNVGRIANYVRSKSNDSFQFVVISLKGAFYEKAHGLVGIWRDVQHQTSSTLTLDLTKYA